MAKSKRKTKETSGILRIKNDLYMVGDDTPGEIWKYELNDKKARLIPIRQDKVKVERMKDGELALDLESIDILADGRMVVLSERLRGLLAQKKPKSDKFELIAEYLTPFTEFGRRGLEGLAVKPLKKKASKVAILWEGGYPDLDDLPLELKHLNSHYLNPQIYIHKIKKDDEVGEVDDDHFAENVFALKAPLPEGDGEYAQRFRAPDLVWHSWGNDETEGFIVILSSKTVDPAVPEEERYKYKWLQRFDMTGKPVGEPIDLDTEVAEMEDAEYLIGANWEGLAWFKPNESLVLIHDKPPRDSNTAVVIELPDDWL